jgi:hypothetical protein
MHTVPLIIGAMTPDVPYYLPWRIAKHIPDLTHTLLGTFTLDLPFGLLLLLFVWLLRAPLLEPLGPAARAKCGAAIERFGSQPRNWALAPLSILVGAWTHLAWDSFTHADGWMVERIPALSGPVSLFSYTGQLCHVLQYASSVFGLTVLAIWFIRLPTPASAREPGNGGRTTGGPVLVAMIFAAAAAVGGFQTAQHLGWHLHPEYHLLYLLLTRTIAWFAALYTLAGMTILAVRRRAAAASVAQI